MNRNSNREKQAYIFKTSVNINSLYPACIITAHSFWQLEEICNLEPVSFQTSWVQEVPPLFLLLNLASILLHAIRIG